MHFSLISFVLGFLCERSGSNTTANGFACLCWQRCEASHCAVFWWQQLCSGIWSWALWVVSTGWH